MTDINATWESGAQALEAGNHELACKKFSEIEGILTSNNQTSPPLSINLAHCQALQGRWDSSVASLGRALKFTELPWERYQITNEIYRIQTQLGLNPADSMPIWKWTIGNALPSSLGVCFVWVFVCAIIAARKHFLSTAVYGTLIALSLAVLGLTTFLLADTHWGLFPMVVTSEKEAIEVYSNLQNEENSKLVDLPRGSLVMVSKQQPLDSPKIRIESPVAGWILREQLLPLDH